MAERSCLLRSVAGATMLLAAVTASAQRTAAAQEAAPAGPVDLSAFVTLLHDDFDTLDLHDGTRGVWSAQNRRRGLQTNGPCSVFLAPGIATADGTPIGIDPFRIEDGVLHIGAGVLSGEALERVRQRLSDFGETRNLDCVRYYTGFISTAPTLALTYGYFEIRARIPEGKGHWPAFWLVPAAPGWPPEIDVFEAYGRGIGRPTNHDDRFTAAVFFDAFDSHRNAVHDVDIVNPFATGPDGAPETPHVRGRHGATQYQFRRRFDARADFGADIYEDFHTYAAAWTPEHITFYFGRDRASLTPVYRTPTPPDVRADMFVVANNQLTTHWGWNPVPGEEAATFAPDNTFAIDSITIAALVPERTVAVAGTSEGADLLDGGAAARIAGTAAADRIGLGPGLDIVDLGGGADTVFADRDGGNAVLTGMGEDDVLVLDGFHFTDAADAARRLTPVGENLWLGDEPGVFEPRTIILEGAAHAAIGAPNLVVRWPVTRPVFGRRDHAFEPLKPDGNGARVEAPARASRLSDAGRRGIVLAGSSEDDVYLVSHPATRIEEAPGGGVDTVRTFVDLALADHVENAVAERDGIALSGNDGPNRLEGKGTGQSFRGRGGDDLVILGEGSATVVVAAGDGHDRVEGFGPDDVLVLQGIAIADAAALAGRIRHTGRDAVLSLGADTSVTLRDVPADRLGPATVRFGPQGAAPGPAGAVPLLRPGRTGPRMAARPGE